MTITSGNDEDQLSWEEAERNHNAIRARMRSEYLARREERDAQRLASTRAMLAAMTPDQIDALMSEDEEFGGEDPRAARREALRIEALKQEEELAAMLSTRGLETLPQAVRRLYRQNPSNPKIRQLHETVVREMYDRADDKLQASIFDAVDTMINVMQYGDTDAARLKAAVYVFERLRGRTPDVIEHRQDRPFEVLLHRVVSGPRSLGDGPARLAEDVGPIEGEIVSTRLTGERTAIPQVSVSEQGGLWDEEEELSHEWDSVLKRFTLDD